MGWGGILWGVMKTLGNQIKSARQQRHMSQSELARKVGCKQSALSMYEGGRATALSAQSIGKICEELGLLPPTQAEMVQAAVVEQVRSYCPNVECVSNLPLRVGDRVVYVPRRHVLAEGECHCAWCGEVLERACPECGAPIGEGAFCGQCGVAYLTGEERHVDERRVAMAERVFAWSH